MSDSNNIVQEIIFDRCPVCQTGRVQNLKPTGIFGFAKSDKISCDYCQAIFIEQGVKEEEKAYKLDLSKSQKEHKYSGQTLKKSEWIRGITDLELCVKNRELPDCVLRSSGFILSENEKTHYFTEAKLYEERAIRQYIGGGVRIGKGAYIGGGQSESHPEVKRLDDGNLLLTNQRLIFNGLHRNNEYKLSNIIYVKDHIDAIEIGYTRKKKSQYFAVSEPSKWATYIKLAISLSKEEKKSNTQRVSRKTEDKASGMIRERYAKGEVTKEQYEQMKKDLGE
jgi:hypothetical protein